jgi:proline dehydrogenase
MVDHSDPNTKKSSKPVVDFSNTEIAFRHKSDLELKKSAWLFSMMNKSWLVDAFTPIGLFAVKVHVPFVPTIIKSTIYEQFVGGTTLLDSQKSIDVLYENKVHSILDYGAEAKSSEKDFNHTMNQCIRSIDFAAANESVPVVSAKITGLARFGLLEDIQKGVSLNKEKRREYRNVLKRLDSICHVANDRKVGVFFDAEESWIQDSIDHLVEIMMKRYNSKNVIVYNTFQMYRQDRLQYLIDSFDRAQKEGYMLGAKLVRGAYMEKERDRAEDKGYTSPIHATKQATDDAYNTALRFCVDNYEKMGSCNATHNQDSCLLLAELIAQKKIPKNHPHLNFCQLYGMSDNITFNLAAKGYNVAKYLVYGSVQDVVPYLARRAKENSAVSGDMSREYALVMKEVKRRENS